MIKLAILTFKLPVLISFSLCVYSKRKVFKNFSYPLAFGPRIDIERKIPFISHHPKVLIERKQFNHVSYITGATANEAGFIVAELLSKSGRPMEEFRDNPIKFMRYSLAYEHREDGERSAERVVYHHLNASKPLMKQLPQIEQVFWRAVYYTYVQLSFHSCIKDALWRQLFQMHRWFSWFVSTIQWKILISLSLYPPSSLFIVTVDRCTG